MEKVISYMSIAQGLLDNFWELKVRLEKDLKPLIEMNGAIEFDSPLYITFYDAGGLNVNKIILGDDGVLLCNEDNGVYRYITDIYDIDDFYNLCKELGM